MPVSEDKAFTDAMESVESGGNPNAVSSKGALGIRQVMPKTGEAMGFSPGQLRTKKGSQAASNKYIDKLEKQFGSNKTVIAGAYNGGPGRMQKYLDGKGDLPAETVEYMGKMNAKQSGLGHSASGPNVDALQQEAEQAQKEADQYNATHGAWASTKRAADYVGKYVSTVVAPAAKQVAVGMYEGEPVGAFFKSKGENQLSPESSTLLSGMEKLLPPPKGDPGWGPALESMDPVAKGLFSAVVSGAEWQAAGKIGSAVSGATMRALTRAGGFATSAAAKYGVDLGTTLASTSSVPEAGIIETGTKAASSLARRQTATRLASGAAGGAAVGAAFGVGGPLAAGQRPTTKDVISNMGLGMAFGLIGGAFGHDTNTRIQQLMPKISATFDNETKAAFNSANQVSVHLDKVFPGQGAAKFIKLAQGTGSEIDRVAFQDVVTQHPELAANPFIAKVINLNRDFATPEVVVDPSLTEGNVRLTYETGDRRTETTVATPRQQDRFDRLAKAGQIYIKKVEGSKEATKQYVGQVSKKIGALQIPDEAKVNDTLNRLEKGTYVDGLFGGKRGVVPEPGWVGGTVGKAPTSLPELTSHEASVAEARRKIGLGLANKGGQPSLTPSEKLGETAFKAAPPTKPPAPFERIETTTPPELLELGPQMVVAAPSTAGGTPIAAPGTEAVLPPSAPLPAGIPETPQLSKPAKLSDVPAKIMKQVSESNWEATERYISTNRSTRQHFINLVTTGTLKPEHITNADMARTLGGLLFENASDVMSDEAKANQLFELSEDFRGRALELGGDNPRDVFPIKEKFNREPTTGDIVRSVPHDDGTTTVVDKHGRTAILDKKDVPSPNPTKIEVGKVDSAESAKKLEHALFSNESPPDITPGPRKKFKPSERGALFSGERTKTPYKSIPVQRLADATGHKLFKLGLPDEPGFIVERGGFSKEYDTLGEALDHMRTGATTDRIAAEQEQVVNSGNLYLPVEAGLSERAKYARIAGNLEENLPKHTKAAITRLQALADNKLAGYFRTGLGTLGRMGKPGQEASKGATVYSSSVELLDNEDALIHNNWDRLLEKYKWDNREELENGNAPPEIQKYYDETLRPNIFDRQYNDGKLLGSRLADPILGNRYVPAMVDIQAKHLQPSVLKEFEEKGITLGEGGAMAGDKTKLAQAAAILNDPEGKLGAMIKANDQADMAKKMDQIKWAKEKGIAIARTLTEEREGNQSHLYNNSTRQTFRRVGAGRNRMNMEAAVFGPNLERINGWAAQIGGNPSFPNHDARAFLQIMNDVRGKVHVPISDAQTALMDFARINLVMSAPKHLTQAGIMFANPRFSGRFMYRGPLEMLKELGSEFGKAPTRLKNLSRRIGALDVKGERIGLYDEIPDQGKYNLTSSMNMSRIGLTEGEKWTMQLADEQTLSRARKFLPGAAKMVGEAASKPLHMFLNVMGRTFARMGGHTFDTIEKGFLEGSPKETSVMHSVLQFKLTPDEYKMVTRDTIRDMFMKNVADLGRFTFRPQDMPVFARTDIGRAALQFRSFQWQMVKAVNNAFNDVNMSKMDRVKFVSRLALALPEIAYLSSSLYKAAGDSTIASTVVYNAHQDMTNAWKHGEHQISDTLNFLVQGWINSHVLSMASTFIEGMDIGSRDVMERELRFSPSLAGVFTNTGWAMATTAKAVESHSSKDWKTAERAALNLAGPAGTMIGRKVTHAKPVRVGKKSIIQKGLRNMEDFVRGK